MTTENRLEVEAQGQDIDKAIEAGLAKMGLERKDVIIEIVDEGSRGLLGIGSRDAVVRLKSLDAHTSQAETRTKTEPVKPQREKSQPKAEPRSDREPQKAAETAVVAPTPKPAAEKTTEATEEDAEIDLEERDMALEIITEMIEKMHVDASVSATLSEPDDLTGRQINVIEVEGDDLGVLIGTRGETLNAIQYISRLMAGHKLQRRANFVVDVEGYRKRRQQALSRLAERMANKVMKRGRPVSLEPMPPNERRIIHMTLRDYDEVYTQSTGEGKRRKVRIFPKS